MIKNEKRAKEFAAFWHNFIEQKRKYTGEPYIVHPAAVVEIVRSVPHTEEMLCAAWLHDVVEDTPVTIDQIYSLFGLKVGYLVEALTDEKPGQANRATRKYNTKIRLAVASPECKTIKLADLIDNTSSIVEHDKEFAAVYMKEKQDLLEVLQEGDKVLLAKANQLIMDYYLGKNKCI